MSHSTKPPPKTRSIPEGERPPGLPLDSVVAVQQRGMANPTMLPMELDTFTVGTEKTCAVVVEDPRGHVSRQHCVLTRRGAGLRVVDQSHNGTWINDKRTRKGEGEDVDAGDVVTIAKTRLLVLDQAMLDARPAMYLGLGLDDHERVDDLVTVAAGSATVILDGEDHIDQLQIAQAIHACSPRRGLPFCPSTAVLSSAAEQTKLCKAASRGTVLLDARHVPRNPRDAADRRVRDDLMRALRDPSYAIRLIVMAETMRNATHAFGEEVLLGAHKVSLVPLRARKQQVGRIADWVLEKSGSRWRVADLDRASATALGTYAWPENLSELREVIRWLAAILDQPKRTVSAAASAIGIPRRTLGDRLAKVGLKFRD